MTLRWVTETYEVREDFCGLLQLDETTSVCSHTTISQYLMSLRIPFMSYTEDRPLMVRPTFKAILMELLVDFKVKTLLLFLLIIWHTVSIYVHKNLVEVLRV